MELDKWINCSYLSLELISSYKLRSQQFKFAKWIISPILSSQDIFTEMVPD